METFDLFKWGDEGRFLPTRPCGNLRYRVCFSAFACFLLSSLKIRAVSFAEADRRGICPDVFECLFLCLCLQASAPTLSGQHADTTVQPQPCFDVIYGSFKGQPTVRFFWVKLKFLSWPHEESADFFCFFWKKKVCSICLFILPFFILMLLHVLSQPLYKVVDKKDIAQPL